MMFQDSIGSGEQTADAVIYNGRCHITALEVLTDGTNDGKVILYDNGLEATGEVIWECTVVGADNYGGRSWNFPRLCNNGIYGDLTGTNASFIVEYIIMDKL